MVRLQGGLRGRGREFAPTSSSLQKGIRHQLVRTLPSGSGEGGPRGVAVRDPLTGELFINELT